MNTKFEFVLGDTIKVYGVILTRIRALRDIPEAGVKAGDLGGYLQFDKNLSHEGSAWVGGSARVGENAWVGGSAQVGENARVYGSAWVDGSARVGENARVGGSAQVGENAWVYGSARVNGSARVMEVTSISPVVISGLLWNVTITDLHIAIGCQTHKIESWDSFGDSEIAAMAGKTALRSWREHKDGLMALARAQAKKAAQVK